MEPFVNGDVTLAFICQMPTDSGRTVGITTWRGCLYVATEYGGVYRVDVDDEGLGHPSPVL